MGGIPSDVPLPLHMHAAVFATGFVDDAPRNTVPSVNKPANSAHQCRVSVFVIDNCWDVAGRSCLIVNTTQSSSKAIDTSTSQV